MLGKMKMGQKIVASFAIAFALLLAIGAVALVATGRISRSVDDYSHRRLPSLSALAQVDDAKTTVQNGLTSLMLRRGNAAFRAEARAHVTENLGRIEAGISAYEAIPHRAETLALWKDVKEAIRAWRANIDALLPALDERSRLLADGKAGDAPAFLAADDRAWPRYVATQETFSAVDRGLSSMWEKTIANGALAEREADEAARGATALITTAIVVGLAVLVLLAVVLSRSVGNAIRALVAEAGKLRDGIAAGRLDVRGDAGVVAPEYRPIVSGMNETMDAYAKPLAMTVDYVTRIARGDIPPRIDDAYQGDFNRIKDAFNECIATVEALVADADTLAKAAVQGHLATRADASRHQGDFRRLVEGVNAAIGALVNHIDAMPAPAMVVGEDLRVRFMNAVALKVAGLERAAVLGQR
jgi:methyl-accepting chemotaxis protein